MLDCGEPAHLSSDDNFAIPPTINSINIDHHNDSNQLLAKLNYVYSAPSACSLLYTIFKKLKIKLTKKEIELLLLGILEDSGLLQFDKISYLDLEMIADLLKQSNNILFDFTHRLSYNEPVDEIKVKKMTFENYHLDIKNKLAYSYGLISDYKKHDIPDGFKISYSPADYLRRTEGINLAFFIKEKSKSNYSISLRSRLPNYDVSKIAAKFNGGGHIMSSGCVIENVKTIEEAIAMLTKEIVKYNKIYDSTHPNKA